MSSSTQNRRRQVQRLALTGVGSAVLLVGIAPTAGAATGVVIPLEPSEVALGAVPVENIGGPMDPKADPAARVFTPAPVKYSGTFTLELPAELDGSGALDVHAGFPQENGDGA